MANANLTAVREAARRDVAIAEERAAAPKRRAMLDMDAERDARGKADNRAEAFELRLQAVTADAKAKQAENLEQLATARAENGRLTAASRNVEADAEAYREQGWTCCVSWRS